MKENKTLYMFQGLASILVVFIHVMFPGDIGIAVSGIARFAVPLFFMISGYTLYFDIGTSRLLHKLKARIKRNGRVTIVAFFIYIFVDIFKRIIKREAILGLFATYLKTDNLLKLVFLGVMPPSSGGVLWFMIALVYVYILLLLVENQINKNNIVKIAVVSAVFMITSNIVKISVTYFDLYVGDLYLGSNWIYGNWIMIGLPCILIGIGLPAILEYLKPKIYNKQRWLLSIIVVCFIVAAAESIYLFNMLNMYLSFMLVTLVADFCVFALADNYCINTDNFVIKIGKYYSRDIYLWHPIFITLVGLGMKFLKMDRISVVAYLEPLFVLVLAIFFSMLLKLVNERLNMGK